MATMAMLRRPETEATLEGRQPDPYLLRALPYDDVYLYCKKIDNSGLVREADPLGGRKCWRAVAMSLAAALFIMILTLPDALGTMAGYQIHSLERGRDQLAQERSRLEAEEAALVSPRRLQELARDLHMVDPDSAHVVYLNPQPDNALASNAPAH